MPRNIVVIIAFSNVRHRNITVSLFGFFQRDFFYLGGKMKERGMYFGKDSIYQKIREVGGVWNDNKQRPIVCLIKSTEHDSLYWAIPVGNWKHRNNEAQQRIISYMNRSKRDIASCFYHVGNTTTKSIFFISDVIPITENYIEREYVQYNGITQYVIKNKKLLSELERKLFRILAFENSKPNYFRQHITDLKNNLLKELTQC